MKRRNFVFLKAEYSVEYCRLLFLELESSSKKSRRKYIEVLR
jgi:hypothetical protein